LNARATPGRPLHCDSRGASRARRKEAYRQGVMQRCVLGPVDQALYCAIGARISQRGRSQWALVHGRWQETGSKSPSRHCNVARKPGNPCRSLQSTVDNRFGITWQVATPVARESWACETTHRRQASRSRYRHAHVFLLQRPNCQIGTAVTGTESRKARPLILAKVLDNAKKRLPDAF
jgi:hypothetical protein